MATLTIAQAVDWLVASVLPNINKEVSDAVVTKTKLPSWLKAKGRFKGGQGGDGIFFQVLLSAQQTLGGAVSDWTQKAHQTVNPPAQATDVYRQFAWPIMLSKFREERYEGAQGAAKLLDQTKDQMAVVLSEARKQLARWLHGSGSQQTGDSSTPPNGIASFISTSNTVHGISQSSYSAWQAQVNTVTNALSDDDGDGVCNLLQEMGETWIACSGAGKTEGVQDGPADTVTTPDLILTTAILYDYYVRAMEAKHQIVNAWPEKVGVVEGVRYKSAQIDWDQFCTANKIWFLNSKYLQFLHMGKDVIRLLETQTVTQPWAKLLLYGGQGQLITRNPRFMGVITNS